MKKIIALLIAGILSITFIGTSLVSTSFAADDGIKVRVSTWVPGAGCEYKDNSGNNCTEGTSGCFIQCNVKPGFKQVSVMFGSMIKYATFLASLGAVLFIVISGIGYTMSGTGGDAEEAKKHIKQVFIGLAVLLLSGYILYIIAPWIYSG